MNKNEATGTQCTKAASVPMIVIEKKKGRILDLNQEAHSVLTSLSRGPFFDGGRNTVTYPPHEHQLLDFVEDHHARVFRQHRAAKKRIARPGLEAGAPAYDISQHVDYRALVDDAPIGIVVVVSRNIVFANREFAKIMHASSPADLLDTDALHYIEPVFRDALSSEADDFASGPKRTRSRKVQLTRLDGKTVDVETIMRKTNYRGMPAFEVMVKDVSEGNAVQEALRRQQSYVSRLHDSIGDLVMLVKLPERIITYANPAVKKISGYRMDECIGKGTRMFYESKRDYERSGHLFREALAAGKKIVRIQIRLKKKNGQMRTGDLTVTFLKEGKRIAHIVCVVRDVTERIRMEEKLKTSEGHRKALLDNIPDSIVFKDRQGRIIAVNEPMARYSGMTAEEMIGKTDSDLLPPKTARQFRASDREAMRNGKSVTIEACFSRDPIGQVWLQVTATPLYDHKKRIIGTVGIARNITELKKAKRALHRYSQQLITTREQEKKGIASTLHDETGAMVVSLDSLLSIIAEDVKERKYEDALRNIVKTKECLQDAIGKLKNIACDLRPPNFEITGIVGALKEYFDKVTERSKVSIRFIPRRVPEHMDADIGIALYRIAQEGITNVIKHAQADTVSINLFRRGNAIVFSMDDNGKGFPAARTESPIGIGLVGMRERVESLSGSFSITGSPGEGTRIFISIPFKKKTEGA